MRKIKNKGVIYTGRVGLKMRPPRHSTSKRVVKVLVGLCGGPFHGFSVKLSRCGGLSTLPIECKGMAGAYVRGTWVGA